MWRVGLRSVLAGVLAGFTLLVAALPATAAGAPALDRRAVLVLVPDLTWADAPPALDAYAKANLSMRSARARTTAADGYLTIGKGAPSAAPSERGVGRVESTPEGGLVLTDWERLQEHDATVRHSGPLGRLGAALDGSGRPWAVVAADPAVMGAAADRRGEAPRGFAGEAGPALRGALDAGAGIVVVGVALADLPAVLEATGSACTVVASVSTPAESRHLGVLAASPPCDLGDGGLASASTHHDHLAALVDVFPTFLERAGVPRPPGVAGAEVTAAPPVARAALIERDERAFAADGARSELVWLFVALSALGAVLAALWPKARMPVAYGLLSIPAGSFLIMLVPWWRWGLGGALLAGTGICVALALAAAVMARGDVAVGVGALAGLAAMVVGVDALLGGPLEIDAPFGNSPVTGARFFGVGNIGSGFLAAGLLVGGGVVLDRWGSRAWPAVAAAIAAGVIAGGAPWFGADVGGVVAYVPAYAVLLLSWRDGRLSPRRLAVGAVIAVAVLAMVALIDAVRPDDAQSHLGRAVGGDNALEQMLRKGERAVNTIRSPMALLIPIGAAALLACRPRLAGRPALRAAGWALLVAGVTGSALNDSGLVVGAAVMAVAWPAYVALGALRSPPSGQPDRPPEPAVVAS